MTKIVNINKEKYDVYIGRNKNNDAGLWGNPWIIGRDGSREEVIERYKQEFNKKILDKEFRAEVLKLKNKTLGCFCRPESICHGDVLKEYLDKRTGLAVIGSRTFVNYAGLVSVWKKYFVGKFDYIVSGGANGADKLGKSLSDETGLDYVEFLPDWDKFGGGAGMIRNKDIINNCSAVLAFWNGESKGTKNSLDLAKEMRKPSFIFYF